MEGDRFDGWAKALAQGASRRRLLRGLGGGLVGAAAVGLGARGAGAAGRPPAGLGGICRTGAPQACGAGLVCCRLPVVGLGLCLPPQRCGGGLGSGCRVPPCCSFYGEFCSTSADCCSGAPCVGNYCSG